MRRATITITTLAFFSACGGCDQSVDDPNSSTTTDADFDVGSRDAAAIERDEGRVERDANANSGRGVDAGLDAYEMPDVGVDAEPDRPGDDASTPDMADPPVCGDGVLEGAEVCDDGNTDDGDYCSTDCGMVTGSCGDGVLQSNESCDDQLTTDCTGTHDGGDGTCAPVGTCSNGYSLDGSGNCVPTNTTGLPTPCSNGSGQTLFRFHYDSGSTSARIDVWDASCSYSFAPNSACNVREVYPGFGEVDRTSDGYPVLTSTEYIRVRFSVAGINFTQATLYVRARSYATASSTNIEAWSPLYASAYVGPVDNDFVYDWYAIDWSNFLYPSDDPDLTAIQLYAYQGSNSLAVRAVELCLE